jgi:transposase
MALKGRRSTPEERLHAVQLLKEGNEAATVARMFNISRAMLFRWQQKYDQGGPVALETKKTPGPASQLSPTQLSKLYAIITGSDPRQLEFDFGLWTRKIIRELIRREFGVKLSEVQVGRLLNKMGLSPQRPLYPRLSAGSGTCGGMEEIRLPEDPQAGSRGGRQHLLRR